MRWDRSLFVAVVFVVIPATAIAAVGTLSFDADAESALPVEPRAVWTPGHTPTWLRPGPDDLLWWGREVSRRFRETPGLPIRMIEETARPARARDVLATQTGLSPPIRRRLHEWGRELVLHEGNVTDLPECRHLKDRPRGLYAEDDATWNTVVGLYAPSTRTAFVQIDRRSARAGATLLHELGHMYDHSQRNLCRRSRWRDVLAADDPRADLGYPEHISFLDKKLCEYFAESFERYHLGRESRAAMRLTYPAAAAYMDVLVREASRQEMRRVEREVDRDLQERLRAEWARSERR